MGVTLPLFIRADIDQIPDEGWWDKTHMNLIGAGIYSRWLAKQVAEFVQQP
jgi:hypothetical protein